MSSFLPFVSNSTNEISIFTAITQKSNGEPYSKLATVYAAVLHLTPEGVKDAYKDTDLTYSEIFEQLYLNSQELKPKKDDIYYWVNVADLLNLENYEEFKQLNYKEIGLVITVLLNLNLIEKALPHHSDKINDIRSLKENCITMQDYKTVGNIVVSEKYPKVVFDSEYQLKAFLDLILHYFDYYEFFPVSVGQTTNDMVLTSPKAVFENEA